MTVYKVEIKYQEREYASQQAAREAAIELAEAGVFQIKLDEDKSNGVKKPKLICKGEVSTFKNSSDAALALLRALKTHKIFFVETHISEDSTK